MIEIVPYTPGWPGEFERYARLLQSALGPLALRIDHIGSTSVPGLAAKDIIDIQVTVAELSPEVETALEQAGLIRSIHVKDHQPPGMPDQPKEWVKRLFKSPADQRPVNIHIRIQGRANQRYPILFRDYLRAHPAAAQAYAQVKTALARLHPDDMDAYYDIKDPVCDIIMAGAEAWAAATGWRGAEVS